MVDISKVRAIDIHTHAEEPFGCHADDGYDELQSTMAKYFGAPWRHPPTISETAAHFREKNVAAVIFPVDAERETGYRRYKNEEVAQLAAENGDILIPFASIDPHKGKLGAREARRLVKEFGVQGFKFHPTMQGFFPNDRLAYPLYEAIQETGKPALFHTGQTGVGSGMRAGNNMRLKYSNPMYLDDVAVDFPDMTIIMAHPSFLGRKRRSLSPTTSRTSTSTCRVGRRSIFRRFSSSTATRFSRRRCFLVPTGR
jgi:uncharacterized protein